MEPKLLQSSIKEEAPERPPQQPSPAQKARSSPPATDAPRPARASSKGSTKEAPDSPEGAQQPQIVNLAGNTTQSSSTSSESCASKSSPPAMGVVNGSNNRDFPSSPPASLNGSGGSPSPPGAAPIAVPISSGSTSQAQLLEARQLAKMRRFLTTIVQFGSDISPETGERVKSLVLALVSNTLGVEEFQRALQAAFNFPLRPFVLPFLRAGIPTMQREVAALARIAKQSPQQYLRQHEQMVLDPSFSPSEPSEIFHSLGEHHPEPAFASKRPRESYYENGVSDSEYAPAAKRYLSYSGQSSSAFFANHPHHMVLHPTGHPSDLVARGSMLGATQTPSTSTHYNPFLTATASGQSSVAADDTRGRCGDDEWKNIHVMLNCILSMVEKTKRALAILQQRPQTESANSDIPATWMRKHPSDTAEQSDIKKAASEIMAQTVKATEERVAEVKRRAEEAVNEVKRQALLELHRAVTAAETKAAELVAAERLRMEKLLLEARKHAEEAPSTSEAGSEISGNCWNCGRKANETCSGCNTARYCGSFCQHKDWENHHQACSITAEKNSSVPKSTASLKVASVNLTATAADGK